MSNNCARKIIETVKALENKVNGDIVFEVVLLTPAKTDTANDEFVKAFFEDLTPIIPVVAAVGSVENYDNLFES